MASGIERAPSTENKIIIMMALLSISIHIQYSLNLYNTYTHVHYITYLLIYSINDH